MGLQLPGLRPKCSEDREALRLKTGSLIREGQCSINDYYLSGLTFYLMQMVLGECTRHVLVVLLNTYIQVP